MFTVIITLGLSTFTYTAHTMNEAVAVALEGRMQGKTVQVIRN